MCGFPTLAKLRDSYRRIASKSYRRDSDHQRSLAVTSQGLVLIDLAFVALRFELRDWRSFVQLSSEECSRASTRKFCPKQGPRKSHEKTTAQKLFF